ncbi:hypothetical protein N8762_00075 [Candidatus Marinamargulisbacteria bacterium]|nr:hypothetical protein [Candidatus Marinamargulisbacteria bacterium]
MALVMGTVYGFEPTWQIRLYGGLPLGPGPYQSSQSPAESVEEYYIKGNSWPGYTVSIKPSNRFGYEQGVEISRQWLDPQLWVVAGYGHTVVHEYRPGVTIKMPVIYIKKTANIANQPTYYDTSNMTETFNLSTSGSTKYIHAGRLGLRKSLYVKHIYTNQFDLYIGGGLVISTASIYGKRHTLPKQNPIKAPSSNDLDREKLIIQPRIQQFYYTNNQVSVYGELGAVFSMNSMLIGTQARFQENPGELSVDEYGRKRLTKERTLVGTVFAGILF